jgi:hypothetical protein
MGDFEDIALRKHYQLTFKVWSKADLEVVTILKTMETVFADHAERRHCLLQ